MSEKITVEYGAEDEASTDVFEQNEYSCDSWRVESGCLILFNARVESGFYWKSLWMPLTNIRRVFVGEGVSSGAIYRR